LGRFQQQLWIWRRWLWRKYANVNDDKYHINYDHNHHNDDD
jgi:hypothetical protein